MIVLSVKRERQFPPAVLPIMPRRYAAARAYGGAWAATLLVSLGGLAGIRPDQASREHVLPEILDQRRVTRDQRGL